MTWDGEGRDPSSQLSRNRDSRGWHWGHSLAKWILDIASSLGASLTGGALPLPESFLSHTWGQIQEEGESSSNFVISSLGLFIF